MTNTSKASFAERLGRDLTLILDGGLATELEAQGHSIDSELWSAELLIRDPGAIQAAHRAFLEAGAQVVISASYQLSRIGLRKLGMKEEDFGGLLESSIRLARRACDEFIGSSTHADSSPLVAASVGPYGAALADGSEYSGDYGVTDDHLRDFHAERLGILDRAGADVLACETIPSGQEAAVLGELLREVETPAWVSFSCRDGEHLNDGTPLRDAARLFAPHPRVLALGVNCTAPRFISDSIGELRSAAPEQAIVVYPNSGESFDADRRCWAGESDPVESAEAALEWKRQGARLIGGCCRMGPEHIRCMVEALGRDG